MNTTLFLKNSITDYITNAYSTLSFERVNEVSYPSKYFRNNVYYSLY